MVFLSILFPTHILTFGNIFGFWPNKVHGKSNFLCLMLVVILLWSFRFCVLSVNIMCCFICSLCFYFCHLFYTLYDYLNDMMPLNKTTFEVTYSQVAWVWFCVTYVKPDFTIMFLVPKESCCFRYFQFPLESCCNHHISANQR